MRELGHGSIVNMSSVSWMRGIPLLEAHASAKAAVVGFTNTLARALGLHRIRVNAIAPGTVLTERQRQLWFQTEAQVEAARAAQCLPDLIAPEDIANLALFLASDERANITYEIAPDLGHWGVEIVGKLKAWAKAIIGPTSPPGKYPQLMNAPGSETGPGPQLVTWGKSTILSVDAHGFKFEYTLNSLKHIPFNWVGP